MDKPAIEPRSQALLENEIQRVERHLLTLVGRAKFEVIQGAIVEAVSHASTTALEMGMSRAMYELPLKLETLGVALNENWMDCINDLIQYTYHFFALKNANDPVPCRTALVAHGVRALLFDGKVFCPLSTLPHSPPCPVGHRGTFFPLPTSEGEKHYAQCCDTRLQEPERLVHISKGHSKGH